MRCTFLFGFNIGDCCSHAVAQSLIEVATCLGQSRFANVLGGLLDGIDPERLGSMASVAEAALLRQGESENTLRNYRSGFATGPPGSCCATGFTAHSLRSGFVTEAELDGLHSIRTRRSTRFGADSPFALRCIRGWQ